MSNGGPEWVGEAVTAAAQNKRVLAVEGDLDVAVYREWLLKRLGSTWANDVYLANAKDRGRLLRGLRHLQQSNDPMKDVIFGLADRDEWEPGDVAALQADLPTLLVNEDRHSLESYFCDPDEVETILLARDSATGRNEFGPHVATLKHQLQDALADYVPHWALGCTIQRANERIRNDAKYPTFFRDACPLPPDGDIRSTLQGWAAILDPAALFATFDALRTSSLGRAASEQFRSCIEPKLFFGKVAVAGPHGLNSIHQQSKDDWLKTLARWSPAMPTDLEAVLQPVLM